jgi:hypothetical protein
MARLVAVDSGFLQAGIARTTAVRETAARLDSCGYVRVTQRMAAAFSIEHMEFSKDLVGLRAMRLGG